MRWRRDRDITADDAPEDVVVVPVDLGRVDAGELARATRRAVARALSEDLGGRTDLTSTLTVPVGTEGRAFLVAREAGVVAGLDVVPEVCQQVDPRITVHLRAFDGDAVERQSVVAELQGPLRTLLTAERTLLNLLCQLSGVATRTRAFADVLEGTGCVVRDTRKTTPGLRLLEKHAVHVGGGANHRIGLYDAVLVKDNHVAAAGGVAAASRAALDGVPAGVHVQVEVTSLDEVRAAIDEGVVDLLLDNFTPDQVREAVGVIDGRAAIEASGGITLETARAYAEAGADRIAVGALTHSAPSLDLALDVIEVVPPERAFEQALADRTAARAAAAEAAEAGEADGDAEEPDEEDVASDPTADETAAEDVAADEAAAEDVADEDVDDASEDGIADAEADADEDVEDADEDVEDADEDDTSAPLFGD